MSKHNDTLDALAYGITALGAMAGYSTEEKGAEPMAKRKEIKFKHTGGKTLEGQQNHIHFLIHEDSRLSETCGPAYSVAAHDMKAGRPIIQTGRHRHFHLDAAKEFCQRIAAGEAEEELETMWAAFDAEDAATEAAAVKAATERAKKFRDKLDAAGISYLALLDFMEQQESIGDIAHNILVGWETGRT